MPLTVSGDATQETLRVLYDEIAASMEEVRRDQERATSDWTRGHCAGALVGLDYALRRVRVRLCATDPEWMPPKPSGIVGA